MIRTRFNHTRVRVLERSFGWEKKSKFSFECQKSLSKLSPKSPKSGELPFQLTLITNPTHPPTVVAAFVVTTIDMSVCEAVFKYCIHFSDAPLPVVPVRLYLGNITEAENHISSLFPSSKSTSKGNFYITEFNMLAGLQQLFYIALAGIKTI